MKNEFDEKFGQVEVLRCNFCDKTTQKELYFPVYQEPSPTPNHMKVALQSLVNIYRTPMKQAKVVKEGICLKCLCKGIMKVCKNDRDKANDYLDYFIKCEVVDKL